MTTSSLKRILLAAAVAAGMAACSDSAMKADHDKFVKAHQGDWDRTRMSFLVEVADQDYKVGDYDKCKDVLKDAIAADVPVASVYVLAAKVELEGGSLEQASNYLKKALALNQKDQNPDPEPYYLMGVVYQRWQQLDNACTYYQQAMDKKPGEAIYVLAVVEMQISLGKLDDARELLESKVGFFEQSSAMRIALARIATLQKDPETAARYYRDATLLAPEDQHLQWSYANALYDAGRYAEAAKILEDLRTQPMDLPPPDSALTKGQTAADRKDGEEGAKANRVTLLMLLGECYVNMTRPANARDCFQEVIRLQPDYLDAYVSLGKACIMTSDLNLTLAAAQHVLRNDPHNVDALILQAAVQQKEKKWTDALATLADAAKVSPRDVTVLCMQGLSALQLGKKDMAADYFEKAVAISPNDSWANDLLSQVRPAAPRPTSFIEPVTPASSPLLGNAPVGVQQLTPEAPAANGVMVGDDPLTITDAAPKD